MAGPETVQTNAADAEDTDREGKQSAEYYGSSLSFIRETDKMAFKNIREPEELGRSRCIFHELQLAHKDPFIPYLSITPINGSLDKCLASLEGPPGTPYAGGTFWLHISYPDNYPHAPMAIRFITPIYHPNIDDEGRICLDILSSAWSPVMHTETVLLSVLSVLHEPELEEALVPEAAGWYREDYETFCAVARRATEEHAFGVRPEGDELECFKCAD